jgi:conjugative transfer region protein TrbK
MKAARLLACLFLVMIAVDAAHVAARQSNITSSGPPPVTDPLAKELERCRALNDRAASDAQCEAAYEESRQRFFQPPSAYHPPPDQVNPDTAAPKLVKPDQTQTM